MNKQIYEQSALSGSSVEQTADENPDGLFNRQDPNLAILHEKPEHRLIIALKLQGRSNIEIAKMTGYTNPWVGQVLRQPWARERILAELNKQSGEGVADLLQGAAADSVFKIIELRDTADDEGVQLRASQDLLDRYLGKATQKVDASAKVTHLSGDAAKLDGEIQQLEAELARITGTSRN